MHWTKHTLVFWFVANSPNLNSAQYHHWLADGFSMNGVSQKIEGSGSGQLSRVWPPLCPNSALTDDCQGRGRGDHSTGQTNSFVNWRRWAGFPRNYPMRKSLGGLQVGMGSPGKVRAVVFRRQPVSWLASCEKGPQLQLPCGIKTTISCSPITTAKHLFVWKGLKELVTASVFHIARPPTSILLASVQKQPKHAHSL